MSSAAIAFPLIYLYIIFIIFVFHIWNKRIDVAAVIAVISQFIIQVPEARNAGFRYKFVFDIKDEYIKKYFT